MRICLPSSEKSTRFPRTSSVPKVEEQQSIVRMFFWGTRKILSWMGRAFVAIIWRESEERSEIACLLEAENGAVKSRKA